MTEVIVACTEAELHLQEYWDRMLSQEVASAIEAHLAVCESCSKAYAFKARFAVVREAVLRWWRVRGALPARSSARSSGATAARPLRGRAGPPQAPTQAAQGTRRRQSRHLSRPSLTRQRIEAPVFDRRLVDCTPNVR